ncbi:restriction endonuclease [Frankia sp. Ag45/Mut15]|uniref:Restriction endonuclease n=2 Tax=Frankia umida TaxID=573489 RepID=A0ABT0K3R4_9ACTN|nr:restriction endonuclease [Frankia umida]
MTSLEQLRGYILEEVLARLLYESGYRLLVSETQDPEALRRGAHGLLVRGRGTDHQADVLGELTLPVPFSLPLRVFVEAKYRAAKTGLGDVRNAHGVIHDVNEHHSTASAGTRAIPMRRYHYRYVLFSTSGFTKPAQQFALAQQISLVDLSSPGFAGLLGAADRVALGLYRLAEEAQVSPFPTGQVRTALRLAFDTWTDRESDDIDDVDANDAVSFQRRASRARWANQMNPAQREFQTLPLDRLESLAAELSGRLGENLVFAFPSAPFVLALRPFDLSALDTYVARNGSEVNVNILFVTRRQVTGDWMIVPADGSRFFQLQFSLPALLEDWLLHDERTAARRARGIKTKLLSSISLFRNGRLIRLQYERPPRG